MTRYLLINLIVQKILETMDVLQSFRSYLYEDGMINFRPCKVETKLMT